MIYSEFFALVLFLDKSLAFSINIKQPVNVSHLPMEGLFFFISTPHYPTFPPPFCSYA